MSEPIRVLCVFASLNRGGSETMCMELYRHIDRSRVQFDFVKHTPQKCAYEDEILSLGGRIYEAPRYLIYNHIAYCRWWKRHLAEHPEHKIIHGHFYTVASVYFKVCKKMNRITVGHSHSTSCDRDKNSKRLISKLKLKYKLHFLKKLEDKSDYCFACSQDAGNWLFPNKKFTVLKNAFDIEKFKFDPETRQNARSELNLADSDFVVGTVGRLINVKNPDGVIDIFKSVLAGNPSAKLLWVGYGELREKIEQRIRQENLTSSVIMTGVRSDVERMLQAMDVFIFPSFLEGLGIVAVEAQTAGMPCFCSDTIPKEVAVTELCSFLPLNQPDLWADKILTSDIKRRDVTQKIRKAGYDINTTSKWLEEFYCGCVNGQ